MDDYLSIKRSLLKKCTDFVLKTETTLQKNMASNIDALLSETKSSAGDKFETGRAMLHLEMEKISKQLNSIQKMKVVLNKISIVNSSEMAKLGSLIETTKGTYFLALSLGKVIVDSNTFYIVSTASPIGKQLLGKKVDEKIPFNNATIIKIF